MELDTVQKFRDSWYRLLGRKSTDPVFNEQGESDDDIANLLLTQGARAAQRWMLRMSYDGWRKRSSALSFTGTDADDGGRKATLPSDFLRAYGAQRPRRSALVEPDGTPWGMLIDPEDDQRHGDLYYFRGTELWIARDASPPATLHLDYHYLHPKFEGLADGNIDFPVEGRPLVVAEAAVMAMNEGWFAGDENHENRIARARSIAREQARHVARQTKQPRMFRKAVRFGNRW